MFGSREYAFLAVGLAAFWALLTAFALFNRPVAAEGVRVFGHHWGLRILAGFLGPVLSLFFALIAIGEPPRDQDLITFLAVKGAFGVVGGLAYWETIRFGFAVTPTGLDVVSPWRGRWFIPWE